MYIGYSADFWEIVKRDWEIVKRDWEIVKKDWETVSFYLSQLRTRPLIYTQVHLLCDDVMTHSYVTWRIYRWHDPFTFDMPHSHVTCLISVTWRFTCDVTSLCDMTDTSHVTYSGDETHSHVTWPIHMWHDSFMWHGSFVFDMIHSHMIWLMHTWEMIVAVTWLIVAVTWLIVAVTWLIHMWHDSVIRHGWCTGVIW